MLFALAWMKRVWQSFMALIFGLADRITVPLISDTMTGFWLTALFCIVSGLVLCTQGFHYHKLIHGLTGSVVLGCLGWYAGVQVSPDQLSTRVVYALVAVIAGFFTLYLMYFLNLLIGGWYFFLALLAPFGGVIHGFRYWIAILLAVAYCWLYVKHKMVMSGVTGAIVLALAAWNLSPVLSAVVLIAGSVGGNMIQRVLYERWRQKKLKEAQEEVEKYPYGPGLAYGWPDPTLQRSREPKI